MKYFTQEENDILLKLVKDAIIEYLKSKIIRYDYQYLRSEDSQINKKFLEIKNCFVTLYDQRGNLRGCIGGTNYNQELYKNIIDHAIQAAFEDSRFSPVKAEEIEGLKFEISVINNIEKIDNIEDFKLGEEGLIVFYMGNSALLLPQVAIDHNIDKQEFINIIINKSGISPDIKLSMIECHKFRVQIIS